MLSTFHSRVRALAVIGMAGVVAATGAMPHAASADAVAAPAAAGADARQVDLPRITSTIKPPAGSRPVGAYVVTRGTQTYTCAGGAFTGASVPEAQLIGTGGRVHHFKGPSWQSERDGSLITAKKTAERPRPGTIPELLLTVDSHTGAGILSNVAYVSRLLTSGGVAPAGACTDGATAAVPYGAVYVFWAAKR
ncbi:DUF3455 domain-containing protein [Micromonospora parathelypteridis]|uniref:DUF3455 domain-containing protein n=1 Tax=Micromonospora parathelypteridis TaxID=1839617 RepID=A0A840VQ98_9ACTN|nr:DUF3455 domain-containing protein [Micromonospora parathelypteridis]MBB5478146.1 hypothetical protein [Micromonospora parathelypteridis]GGO07747.1 hypothetical protein GCM10011576_12630 [Micromonospora parathelypteridis]